MALNYPNLSQNGGSIFPPKTLLGVNQFLKSPSGRYTLINQEDLNLVLYDGSTPVWVGSGREQYMNETYRKHWDKSEVSQVYMNGGLGLLDLQRGRLISTVLSDIPGGDYVAARDRIFMQLQDDGNMVIIDQFPRWYASGVPMLSAGLPSTIIAPGTIINPGDVYSIGQSKLVFQGDGNLVFYGKENRVLWASYTQNKNASFAAMQGDGNFVIYNAAKQPIWSTNTAGFPGAYARIQESGCFTIVTDQVCWARYGYTPVKKPVRVYYPNHADPVEQGHAPFPTYGHIGYEF